MVTGNTAASFHPYGAFRKLIPPRSGDVTGNISPEGINGEMVSALLCRLEQSDAGKIYGKHILAAIADFQKTIQRHIEIDRKGGIV